MADVIRFCKLKESHNGPNVFDVSRPNIMGNPFTHIKDRTTKALVVVSSRDEAIDLYDEYFERMLKTDQHFREEWDRMFEAYCNYDKVYIGCFCNLDERCHGDIIAAKLKQRGIKKMLENLKIKKPKDK